MSLTINDATACDTCRPCANTNIEVMDEERGTAKP